MAYLQTMHWIKLDTKMTWISSITNVFEFAISVLTSRIMSCMSFKIVANFFVDYETRIKDHAEY